MKRNHIYCTDAQQWLETLPDESINCVVTSPPYWSLRDYGVPGQLGLEATPQEFVQRMVVLFREARRVLRDDGTLWLNLGDSYWANRSQTGESGGHGKNFLGAQDRAIRAGGKSDYFKPKDMVGIPWRVAFALQDDGWYLRSDIIWHKPNPMPESVTDRPTKSHEYIFLLSKNARYWYDADAIREESKPESHERAMRGVSDQHKNLVIPGQTQHSMHKARANGEGYNMPTQRNKRTVWTVATQPLKQAHFATFPLALIDPCVKAGCPPKVCGVCGAPWERVVEKGKLVFGDAHTRPNRRVNVDDSNFDAWSRPNGLGATQVPGAYFERINKGWQPTCDCNAATRPGITLDPFMGAGTTALVAIKNERDYVGCELNPEYVEMANQRIAEFNPYQNTPHESGNVQLSLFGGES